MAAGVVAAIQRVHPAAMCRRIDTITTKAKQRIELATRRRAGRQVARPQAPHPRADSEVLYPVAAFNITEVAAPAAPEAGSRDPSMGH